MSLFDFDKEILKSKFLIGCDEAGRGPGAGGVYAAAVCFNNLSKDLIKDLAKLNDSKKVTEKIREELYPVIVENTVYSVNFCSVEEIEKINILQASLKAMKISALDVISKLKCEDVFVIIDGKQTLPELKYNQKNIIKGDATSASIAAASILAKVTRDRYMCEIDKEFPQYGWAHNKGYLTPQHLAAIDKYGLTKYHRPKFLEKHFEKQMSLF